MKGTRGTIISGLLGAASLVASPAIFAQEPAGQGGYIGGAFGQSKLNGGCDDFRSAFAANGGTTSSCDETDTGWKLYGGIRVNPHFNVEFSYINWGEISSAGTLVGIPVRATGEATSFGVAAMGVLPLNERFSLFGKAGLLMTDVKVTIAGGGVVGSGTDDTTELHIGVGALFNLADRWQLRAEWERGQDSKLDLLSVGVQYRF
jgi:OOP family OmpA-OmpF porin